MKKVLALTLAMMTMFALGGCTKKADDTVLRVGMECAYAPFNWTQSDNANGGVTIQGSSEFANGYDVSVAKEIAKGLGKELVIVKTDWDGLLPSLTSGKIDMIIAGMSPTAERKESIDFSDNYYTSDLVVVVKKDSKFATATSIQDFSGAKLTAQLNTFHYGVLDQMKGIEKQAALEDFPTMIVALLSGKIDGYVSERPGALSAVASNPDLTFVEFEKEEDNFEYDTNDVSIAVGLKKGNDLLPQINTILAGISEDTREQFMNDAIANQPSVE